MRQFRQISVFPFFLMCEFEIFISSALQKKMSFHFFPTKFWVCGLICNWSWIQPNFQTIPLFYLSYLCVLLFFFSFPFSFFPEDSASHFNFLLFVLFVWKLKQIKKKRLGVGKTQNLGELRGKADRVGNSDVFVFQVWASIWTFSSLSKYHRISQLSFKRDFESRARDSTTRSVRLSVGLSVGRSHFAFCCCFTSF